jgi:biopolymer transport protein ExbB
MILGLMEPSGLIEQGGPLVWVLLGLGFLGAVCVVERLFFFHRARINVGNLLVGLSHHIRRRAFAEALHEAARAPGPVARVVHAALLRYYLPRADLRDVVQEAGQMEVPRIEKNIRAILGAALLAPLVGMLGTLLGMLETFQKVSEQGGFTGPAELSAGVFTALITSVIGLTVAIPLYLFYLYFLGRAKRLVHRLERAGIEMVNLISDAREEEEFAPFRGEVTAGKKAAKANRACEMKLEMTLPERPGFLHAVPLLNIFALVQLFFLLGPSLVWQSGVAVDLPPSKFQMERYETPLAVTLGPGEPTPRIHFARDSVTLEELSERLDRLRENGAQAKAIVLLQTDTGTPVGTEREVTEMVLAKGFRLALVGKNVPAVTLPGPKPSSK